MSIERHDIEQARRASGETYSAGDFARRIAWAAVRPLFAWSPRHIYGWRNFLLRLFGAKIGRAVRIYPSVRIFDPRKLWIADEVTIGRNVTLYNLAPITIGDRTMISQNAHLCAGSHDCRQARLPFDNRPITVASDVWICADAYVGNGVAIMKLAVVAARSVAVKDVPERAIVGGNPARVIGQR